MSCATSVGAHLFLHEFPLFRPPHFNFNPSPRLRSYRLYTFKVLLYETAVDNLRAVGEAIIVLGCLYFLSLEASQMVKRGVGGYLRDVGNAFDITLQALLIAMIVYWISNVNNPHRTAITLNSSCGGCAPGNATCGCPAGNPGSVWSEPDCCWIDMVGYAQEYTYAVTFAGFIGLLMSLKFYKYFTFGAAWWWWWWWWLPYLDCSADRLR
jgi:hypothetical protein